MSQYGEYRYRMSEAKRRVRSGIRAGARDSRRARNRLTGAWVAIACFVIAAIAAYLYSLT